MVSSALMFQSVTMGATQHAVSDACTARQGGSSMVSSNLEITAGSGGYETSTKGVSTAAGTIARVVPLANMRFNLTDLSGLQ